MDPANRTLDSMLAVPDPSLLSAFAQTQYDGDRPAKRRAVGISTHSAVELEDDEDGIPEVDSDTLDPMPREDRGREVEESVCEFTSILELRRLAKKRGSSGETRAPFLNTLSRA